MHWQNKGPICNGQLVAGTDESEHLIIQGCRFVVVLPNGKVVLERQQQKTAEKDLDHMTGWV